MKELDWQKNIADIMWATRTSKRQKSSIICTIDNKGDTKMYENCTNICLLSAAYNILTILKDKLVIFVDCRSNSTSRLIFSLRQLKCTTRCLIPTYLLNESGTMQNKDILTPTLFKNSVRKSNVNIHQRV